MERTFVISFFIFMQFQVKENPGYIIFVKLFQIYIC